MKKLPKGWTVSKEITGHAYGRNGNAHNPTPRVSWVLKDVNGKIVDRASVKRKLVEFYGIDDARKVPDKTSDVTNKTAAQLEREIAEALSQRDITSMSLIQLATEVRHQRTMMLLRPGERRERQANIDVLELEQRRREGRAP